MKEISWERCATVPKDHQKVGVRELLKRDDPATGRVIPGVFLLADEVGCGKSKQGVDSTQFAYDWDAIDTVLALCPAQGRAVWANEDPEIGEVAKHGWDDIPNYIIEYSVRHPQIAPALPKHLNWVVANYEFIRREERLKPLMKWLMGRRIWLICDEAWCLSDAQTDQWKAVFKLRSMKGVRRVTLMNGSPVTDSPLDLFAQMKMLDWRILGYKYMSHFRSRYALLKPNVTYPQITGWQNLEELRNNIRPYVLNRKTEDCWDLPPVLDPITIEVKLTDETWRVYKQMRDEMVAWIDGGADGNVASVAKQAIVKAMRLAQITSGFVGGVQQLDFDGELLDFADPADVPVPINPIRILSSEKIDGTLKWLSEHPQPERLLIWSRFRVEIERMAARLGMESNRQIHLLYGEQSHADREAALHALNPGIPQDRPQGVVGNPLAGGAAVNLAGASLAITLSQDTKLRVYLQARGRVRRPGQTKPVAYADVVATGPKGQRTIDHHIAAALRGKNDIAMWTTATWRRILTEE